MGNTNLGWFWASGTAIVAFMALVALRGGWFLFALWPLILVVGLMVLIAWSGRGIAKLVAISEPNKPVRPKNSVAMLVILTFIAIGTAFGAGIISAGGMKQNKMPTLKTLTQVNLRPTR